MPIAPITPPAGSETDELTMPDELTGDIELIEIEQIFSPEQLDAAMKAGYIESFRHPNLPLTIYNYTERVQYDGKWDAASLACRGLIVHDNRTVVARPWPKFFEYKPTGGQHGPIDLDAPVEVLDKLDGSLGILYWADNDWAIATRGSFTGVQAVHATDLYRARYGNQWTPNPGVTYLFEIVYPDNRVVLDYGDTDDLVLLGGCRIADGSAVRAGEIKDWPGPRAATMGVSSLREALALPARVNAEGFVVTLIDSGLKLKVKQRDYVLRHRMVTGMSVLAVWEYLASGQGIEGLIDAGHLPDELHQWARETIGELQCRHDALKTAAVAAHTDIVERLGATHTRKEYAAETANHPQLRGFLFALADGREDKLDAAIWKAIRPDGNELVAG